VIISEIDHRLIDIVIAENNGYQARQVKPYDFIASFHKLAPVTKLLF
jgi:hypothetical protein